MAARITPDTWTRQAWTHDAVMTMASHLDPTRMTRYADEWRREVDRIEAVLDDLNRKVAGQLDQSWRGGGANASHDALRRYVAGSRDGLDACRSVADRLVELSDAAGALRSAITPPAPGELADQRLDEALAQVRHLYSDPAVSSGNAVDDIPPPPEPFGAATVPSAATLPAGSAPAGNPTGAASPVPPLAAPAPSLPGLGTPTSRPQDPFPTAVSQTPWRPTTHTSGYSSPDPLVQAPDRAFTAPSPSAALDPVTPAAGAAVGTHNRAMPMTPFLGGAYAPHAGRDDGGGEHRVPGYLISAGNGSELVGELPMVAPPVLGEW